MGADFREGRSRPPDFQEILQGGGASDPPVRRRVMGDVSSDWEDPGRFPPQGGLPAGKDADKEEHDGAGEFIHRWTRQ